MYKQSSPATARLLGVLQIACDSSQHVPEPDDPLRKPEVRRRVLELRGLRPVRKGSDHERGDTLHAPISRGADRYQPAVVSTQADLQIYRSTDLSLPLSQPGSLWYYNLIFGDFSDWLLVTSSFVFIYHSQRITALVCHVWYSPIACDYSYTDRQFTISALPDFMKGLWCGSQAITIHHNLISSYKCKNAKTEQKKSSFRGFRSILGETTSLSGHHSWFGTTTHTTKLPGITVPGISLTGCLWLQGSQDG